MSAVIHAGRTLRRGRLTGLGLLALGLLGGCAGPQPWEKGDLARPEMRLDRDPLEARFAGHVTASKEASSGGEGVGGGGCGCN